MDENSGTIGLEILSEAKDLVSGKINKRQLSLNIEVPEILISILSAGLGHEPTERELSDAISSMLEQVLLESMKATNEITEDIFGEELSKISDSLKGTFEDAEKVIKNLSIYAEALQSINDKGES